MEQSQKEGSPTLPPPNSPPQNPISSKLRRVQSNSTKRNSGSHGSSWGWLLFIAPALIIYVVFMAFPLINSMRLSFYTGSGLTPEKFVGLDNYVELLTNPLWRRPFLNAFDNNVIFFLITMLVQNTLALLFAVLLSQPFRGRDIYRTIIFAPVTLSILVSGFLWRLILNPQWGAFNQMLEAVGLGMLARPWLGDQTLALPVITLVSTWQWIGLPTMMFLAGLLTIPDEIIEAARVDGATSWLIFWKIKLPLLAPIVGIVSIITYVNNFNAFDIVYTMTGAQGSPNYTTDLLATFFYRTGIAGEQPCACPDMGLGAAVATLTFVFLLAGVSLWLVLSRKYTYDS